MLPPKRHSEYDVLSKIINSLPSADVMIEDMPCDGLPNPYWEVRTPQQCSRADAALEFLGMVLLGKPIRRVYRDDAFDFCTSTMDGGDENVRLMKAVASYGPRALRRWGRGEAILPHTQRVKSVATPSARSGMSELIRSLSSDATAMKTLASLVMAATSVGGQSWVRELFPNFDGRNVRLRLSNADIAYMLLYQHAVYHVDSLHLHGRDKSLIKALYDDGSHDESQRLAPTLGEIGALLTSGYHPGSVSTWPGDFDWCKEMKRAHAANDEAEAALWNLRNKG